MIYHNLLLILLLYTKYNEAYIYPIVCRTCGNKIDAVFNELQLDENRYGLDTVRSVMVPISNGLCGIWWNFLEVYECLSSKYYQQEKAPAPKERSLLDGIGTWMGIVKEEEPPAKCNYYSITIVSVTTLFVMLLLYSVKKMIDYFKEDDYPFEVKFNERFKMCSCKLNGFVYDESRTTNRTPTCGSPISNRRNSQQDRRRPTHRDDVTPLPTSERKRERDTATRESPTVEFGFSLVAFSPRLSQSVSKRGRRRNDAQAPVDRRFGSRRARRDGPLRGRSQSRGVVQARNVRGQVEKRRYVDHALHGDVDRRHQVRFQFGPRPAVLVPAGRGPGDQGLGPRSGGHVRGREAQAGDPAPPGLRRQGRRQRHPRQGDAGVRSRADQHRRRQANADQRLQGDRPRQRQPAQPRRSERVPEEADGGGRRGRAQRRDEEHAGRAR